MSEKKSGGFWSFLKNMFTTPEEINGQDPTPATAPEVQTVPQPEPQQPVPQEPESTIKTYHATGMTFRMENLMRLAIKNDEYSLSKRDMIEAGLIGERVWEYDFYANKVELVPEPDNPQDPKAIKVIADGEHIAYIKKGSCSHLLKIIKEDRIDGPIRAEIKGGKYKFIAEDEWDDLGEKCTYTLEKDTVPHFVWLHIKEKSE